MGLPSSWVECCLKDIGKIVSGGTPKTAVESYFGGTHAWITPADLTGYKDVYISRGKRSLTEAGLKHSSAVLMPTGSVLFSSRAPIGYVAISSNPISTNQGFKSIIPYESVVSKYVYYYLKFSRSSIEHLATGTTFKEISARSFGSIKFVLPPLAEQRRIVEKIDALFSELDKGVDYLNKVKEQLQTYRQAVLKWAFEGEIFDWVKMKDISSSFGGGTFKSGNFKPSGPYQVLRIGNVRPGLIRYGERPVYIETLGDWSKRYLLNKNDVIITLTGTRKKRDYGFTAIVDRNNVLLNQRIAAIRFESTYLPRFFLYYSWTRKFRDDFFADETGNVGQGNVGMKAITQTYIPFCSVKKQEKIVSEIESRLSVCDKLGQIVYENLSKAEALRQSILKKAFEGRLVPQDPNDEPAEKLLERIKDEQASSKSSTKRGNKHA